MAESFGSELVHLRCGICRQINSLSYQSLEQNSRPACSYCGSAIAVDLAAARRDAAREAHELDAGVDALGSIDD